MERNYYLHKDSKTGEILYLEYNKMKGYPITPRTRVEDAISVNKIVFVNPSLREKLIRKKVDIKLRYLFRFLGNLDDDSGDEGAIQNTIMEAERLRVNILNRYIYYLGNTYGSYSVRKIELIINQLKIKLYNLNMKRKMTNIYQDELFYLEDEEVKKGRGR